MSTISDKNNMDKISKLLTPYANEMEDERLGVFLTLSVGRILLKKEIEISENDLRHITDWLKASLINNEPWVSNLDSSGRPKKLMKFSDIEGIIKEADKAMLVNAQKMSHVKLVEGDEELFAELQDGYYLVKLLTSNALDKESSVMQHCIGAGSYDLELENDNVLFLSLRDPAGKAHVTLEIVDLNIKQIQGKQNNSPIKKYQDILAPFLESKKYNISRIRTENFGYLTDEEGKWHDIYNLPEGFIVRKVSLEYRANEDAEIILPNNLRILGSLKIKNCNIKSLPKGLIVENNLEIKDCNLKTLPNDMEIENSLIITNLAIETFPAGIKVSRELSISECHNLKKLSDNLNLEKLTLINNSSLDNLPKELNVKYTLTLQRNPMKEISKDLKVGQNIYIDDLPITELPEELEINGRLSILNTNIETLPHLKVIKGSLNLRNNKIKSLPDYLHVNEVLNLTGNPIKELPRKLHVGNLLINKTEIKSLPDDLIIYNCIFMDENQITHFPDCIPSYIGIYMTSEDGSDNIYMTVGEFREEALKNIHGI